MAFIDRLPLGQRPAVHNWEVDNLTDRNALTEESEGVPISEASVGKEARVGTAPPYAYYRIDAVLFTPSLSIVWSANIVAAGGGGGGTPSDSEPPAIGTGTAGVATEYSRGDHTHDSPVGMATQTQLTNGLATKADDAATTAALNQKADATATATALAGKADASATATSLAGKAAVATEQGFMGTNRTLTGNDTAIAADVGADLDTSSASDFTLAFNNGLGRKGCLITVYIGSTGAITPIQGTGTVTFIPLPGKTVKSAGLGACVQYRKKTHSGAGDVWNVTGTLV